jgi:drug/metabolite transporter (DMT)-like permease
MLEMLSAILGVFLIATSQVLFKKAARPDRSPLRVLTQTPVIVGLALNGLAAICWVFALRTLELNFAFPLLSLNYLIIPVVAYIFFSEKFTPLKIGAIFLIGTGVALCLAAG